MYKDGDAGAGGAGARRRPTQPSPMMMSGSLRGWSLFLLLLLLRDSRRNCDVRT